LSHQIVEVRFENSRPRLRMSLRISIRHYAGGAP
jgi:hypothetical protein